MAVKPIPTGYHSYTPYYVVEDAPALIDFLKAAFGAEETLRMPGPDGRVGHAECRIGDSMLMMADAHPPEHGARQLNGMLYVTDVDATFESAVAAGAKAIRPPETMFYGDRIGGVVDRWGNYWAIATHVEDVSPEEMARRAETYKPDSS